MTDLNDFNYVNDDDDVLAEHPNELMAASLLSKFKNIETLAATRTLLDLDTPIQRFDCNGAPRIVKMPASDSVTNHPYVIVNATGSGSHTLSIQSNDGSVAHVTLSPSDFAFLQPDGNGEYILVSSTAGISGGLLVSNATVTSANVDGVTGTLHNLDVSGMTANRDFNLPTPLEAGDRIGVRLSAGDDTYVLLVKINGVEWSRLAITNEIVTFVSTGTGAADWAVEIDGRIAFATRVMNTASQSIPNSTVTTITLDEEDTDFSVGDCADTGNNGIKVRRTGKYRIHAYVRYSNITAAISRAILWVMDELGATVAVFEINALSGTYPTLRIATEILLTAGKTYHLEVSQGSGVSQSTYVTGIATSLEIVESNGGGGGSVGGGGGALSDGDYGDITVGGSGTTMTIDPNAVTLAKLVQATAQYKLLGRLSSGAGNFEEISGSANVFSLLQAADYAAIRTLLGLVVGTNVQAYDADLDAWAGKTAPSGAVAGTTDTQTLTNKRVTPRVGTVASSATPTINTDNYDVFTITALTVDITSMTTNLSGTPTDGQKLWIAITGTAARAITWGASFEASTIALPTTTVSTNRLDVGFVWNAATSKWRCIGYV